MSVETTARRRQFESDGYFILPWFFSRDAIYETTAVIDEHMLRLREEQEQRPARARRGMLVIDFLAEKEPRLVAFCRDPKLVNVVSELIAPELRLFYNQAIYKSPETAREFPWHQDNGYAPVKPDEYVTCWVALNDATIENGCIWLQPGSHRQGTLDHVESDIGKVAYHGSSEGMPAPIEAGGVLVFSSLLLHRSGPNTSSDTRKAYILQYVPANAYNGRTGATYEDRMLITGG